MPTTTPLTDAINALTTYANETTGASDTTLSDAVATLIEGYGQGGGGIGDFETGSFVGDGTSSSSYMSLPVSRLYSNFICYTTDTTGHATNDFVMLYGTANLYIGVMFAGTGIWSYTTQQTNSGYLKFYNTRIDVKFAVNGGYCKLHDGITYKWIAWNDDGSNRTYIVKDGVVQDGFTFGTHANTTITQQTGYIHAKTAGNNYGAFWTNSFDLSPYKYGELVVELFDAEGNGIYGYVWNGGALGIGKGQSTTGYDVPNTYSSLGTFTIDNTTNNVTHDKFKIFVPYISSNGYVKFEVTGTGAQTYGYLNIANLYFKY